MPSQSVEAATREEAIAAAREEYGPSAKIVGVRRIRSGGVLGFFAAERYVAEVDLSARSAPAGGGSARRPDDRADPGTGSRSDGAPRRAPRARPAESVDDRMSELADLLGPSSGQLPIGLYSAAGVARGPAIEDVVAQRRPRTAPAPETPAGGLRASAPARTTGPAAAPIGSTAAPRGGAAPRDSAPVAGLARGSFAAAVQAAAAAPAATPFTPSRHRPTLDRFVETAPEPAAEPEPAGPSPFTAALARMVADRSVSVAVTAAVTDADADADAVERSAADERAADHRTADDLGSDGLGFEPVEEPVFRVRAEEWIDETEEAVPAPVAAVPAATPAPVAASAPPAPVTAPAPAAPGAAPGAPAQPAAALPDVAAAASAAADAPQSLDQRAALQSALQSVLRSAGSTDRDMERLLEGVLERVLSGEAATAAAVELDESSSRGRHRFPEPTATSQPVTSHPATSEMAAVRPDHAPLPGTLRPVPVPVGTAAENLAALTPDPLDEELAELAGDRTADDWAADWADDVRVQEARVHELRRDVVVDMQRHEVLAHREPLVMTPSMAAWPAMARTASDPAPLSMDATTILPPLSLLPPQRMPSIGGLPPLLKGRPAVPPARRPLASGPSTASRPAISGRPAVPDRLEGAERTALEVAPRQVPLAAAEVGPRLATVTRLVPIPSSSGELAPYGVSSGEELVVQLLALGVPEFLISPGFAGDAATRGLYAALTRTLSDRLAPVPDVPAEPGSVLLVVGPGPETLAAARSLAVSVRLDPAAVQWATPGDAASLVPEHSRITTLETATERHRISERAGTVTIVAVDAPLRTGGGNWLAHMLAIWAPDAVWGVVDATRKLEDVVPWLDALPRLDAVVVQETEATADPAAVLSHLTAPVARIDGARATAHRWASLLCERLEDM
ncbi:hypothetical protein [Modestobacter lapidis]|nr:hypothetical protein [Modestobacter lapidis]